MVFHSPVRWFPRACSPPGAVRESRTEKQKLRVPEPQPYDFTRRFLPCLGSRRSTCWRKHFEQLCSNVPEIKLFMKLQPREKLEFRKK
jgi:hypothetical protein